MLGYGITERRVIGVLGKPKNEWASEDIAALRGMASQLKDGQAAPEQLFPATEAPAEKPGAKPPEPATKARRGRVPKTEAAASTPPPTSLLPPAATAADLEAIYLTCLEKGIDLELILDKWQVSRLEELDGPSAQRVREWLKGQ